ncbi:Mannan endo-1-6-alpha-mannosidase DCW1 [Penicillium maclennaniae]|uniref:Mannan endo-1-6-alpha-mannosidase DCW1 n=1 Tax=Penicillium maclennaniae TaxID=1343394 RepID=UPI002541C358|nr:Mannan endo-1-6-alpha-mannosidase DCW1 [Penicillium maclennaniae]KAJ5667675.1 Mannan endo-1-6-alpha-mannosidase DCW1 [Penicillium maclennaniae]
MWKGNDDQTFSGHAAIMAAELQVADSFTGCLWLALAEGVFNTHTNRWDTSSCDGGKQWQIWPYESGYTMKNSISNSDLFQISGRLARYTGPDNYAKWAEKIWDWTLTIPSMSNLTWNVADSANTDNDCATQGNTQWSYNYGTFLTNGSVVWLRAVNGLMTQTFDHISPQSTVESSRRSFRSQLSWFHQPTTPFWPDYERLLQPLRFLARDTTTTHVVLVGISKWDGWIGMEQEISASNIFLANMIPYVSKSPVLSRNGVTVSNPTAGENDTSSNTTSETTITTADRAGVVLYLLFLSQRGSY